MNERALKRLMGSIPDPKRPRKELVWRIILWEFVGFDRDINLLKPDAKKFRSAFNISYFGHLYTPPRESGEAYLFHIVRAVIRMIWRSRRLGLYSIIAILYLLVHDCFEDAIKSRRNRQLLQNKVTRQVGARITFGTLTLTKQKERGETNEEYFLRILKTALWEVIWAKFEDRIDNIYTIMSMSPEKARAKILETERWFPLLRDCLAGLIEKEIAAGRLEEVYRKLPEDLWKHLRRVVRMQKRKLNLQ